jgi:hypothetical protein
MHYSLNQYPVRTLKELPADFKALGQELQGSCCRIVPGGILESVGYQNPYTLKATQSEES